MDKENMVERKNTHMMEYHSAFKKKDILLFATMCMITYVK